MPSSPGRPRARPIVALLAACAALAGAPGASAVQMPHPLIVSEDPADLTPNVLNGRVYAITLVGDTVVAGGVFANVSEPGGTPTPRTNLFAFDAGTGSISAGFAPSLNDIVRGLATDGASVFVGGDFSRVNEIRSVRLAKLDLNGQKVPGFQANITGDGVYDLVYANDLLYVAGAFTAVNGVARDGLAALDPVTGAVQPGVDIAFTGLHNGGFTRVAKLDVSPDGATLVAVGNFTTVAGLPREQIVLLDLSGGAASVSDWSTQRFAGQCAIKFDTYIRDVDISPDGSYFVVATTGAFVGGANAGVLCDTATRWEMGRSGPAQQPTWTDYAGGDTTWSIASTGAAIYVGGHFRWRNNPYAGDMIGPGAIRRRGIAALDPINGVPFSWNPGRKLGEGVFSLVGTDQGLWVGNDTDVIGGESHARIAFFPLAGGSTVPVEVPATLPGTLWSVPGATCPGIDPSVLYRVNAGGPSLPSFDCGPGWAADDAVSPSPYRNAGSSSTVWNPVPSVDDTVPATTPGAIFATERYDPGAQPEMQWDFPVPAGTHVRVRLFLADRCSCTNGVNTRVFDVRIEGTTVLNDLDLNASPGHGVGTMRTADVTSDGTVTITFIHVKENPLIDGIELIDRDATPVVRTPQEHLLARPFDGASTGSPSALATPGIDWSHARGAFVTNGTLYTGWDDGRMYARPFDGTKLGKAKPVYLFGLSPGYLPIAGVTGMFFERGRLYYTVTGDDRLFMRFFSPQSNILGSVAQVVSGPGDGFAWGTLRGMTLAEGGVFLGRADGSLSRVAWFDGAPVAGSQTQIDASGTFASNGLFLRNP